MAGEGVPLATQRLHAFFEAAFARVIGAAEQQVFEQVRQLLVGTAEIIQPHPDHQPDRHVSAVTGGFEDQLQAVGQLVAFNAGTVEGKALDGAEQQADEQQATHKKSLNPCRVCDAVDAGSKD